MFFFMFFTKKTPLPLCAHQPVELPSQSSTTQGSPTYLFIYITFLYFNTHSILAIIKYYVEDTNSKIFVC